MVPWKPKEKQTALSLVEQMGHKWALISKHLEESNFKRHPGQIRNMVDRHFKNQQDDQPNSSTRRNLCSVCGELKKGHVCGMPKPTEDRTWPNQSADKTPPRSDKNELLNRWNVEQKSAPSTTPKSHKSVFDLWRDDNTFSYDDFACPVRMYSSDTASTSLASSKQTSPIAASLNPTETPSEHIPVLELPPPSILHNCLPPRKATQGGQTPRLKMVEQYLTMCA